MHEPSIQEYGTTFKFKGILRVSFYVTFKWDSRVLAMLIPFVPLFRTEKLALYSRCEGH